MNAVNETKNRTVENERCNGCGSLLCKVHTAGNYLFVELKCANCKRFVIKKFWKPEIKSKEDTSHAA